MLIAVGPSARVLGVHVPGYSGLTYDWREKPGAAGNTAKVLPLYRVLDLAEALREKQLTDAHFVSYVMHGADGAPLARQPRITKGSLAWVEGQGFTLRAGVLAADVDNAHHLAWTTETLQDALERLAEVEALRTAGVYFTTHGYRIVQPLVEMLALDVFEGTLAGWLDGLERQGLGPDRSCKDWTRHFRLPFARRPGFRGRRTPEPMLDNMVPIRVEASAPVRRARGSGGGPSAPIAWEPSIPEVWLPRVARLVETVRAAGPSHDLFLALGGALLARGVSPALLPEIVGAVSAGADTTDRCEERMHDARSTAERFVACEPVTGLSTLRRRWEAVAEAVVDITSTGRAARLRVGEATPQPTVAEASVAMRTVMWKAGPGVTLIRAACGLGKTVAAIDVAVARAEKQAGPKAVGTRAPPQSKTGISVPTNALAVQVAQDLRARGATVLRVFGALSVMGPDGQPVCRYYESAAALQGGGQSVPWEMCAGRGRSPCKYRQSCTAADGMEGPANARIIVGPHTLVGSIAAAAGSTGMLFCDEPPEMLVNVTMRESEVDEALTTLDAFERTFAAAVGMVAKLVRRWMDTAPLETPFELTEIVESEKARARANGTEGGVIDPTEVLEAVRNARPSDARGGPPLRWREMSLARESVRYARRLAAGSRLFGAIHHAATSQTSVVWRVDNTTKGRVLVITSPREEYIAALRREGATVVMDASIELHAPVIEKVVGYKPPLLTFVAADGAPVERVVLHTRASRKAWWRGPVPEAELIARALHQALGLVGEARSVAIITWKKVRFALEATLRPSDPAPAQGWRDEGLKVEDLHAAREAYAPTLDGFKGALLFGHYGAVRGLNAMAECDALISLGDPWPPLIGARNDALYCDLDDLDERYQGLVQAELEQAHGRLRTIHRTKPAVAVHVGAVRPGGPGWDRARTVERQNGRPPTVGAMAAAEARALVEQMGGIAVALKALGIGRASLHRYLVGLRGIPTDVANALRRRACP